MPRRSRTMLVCTLPVATSVTHPEYLCLLFNVEYCQQVGDFESKAFPNLDAPNLLCLAIEFLGARVTVSSLPCSHHPTSGGSISSRYVHGHSYPFSSSPHSPRSFVIVSWHQEGNNDQSQRCCCCDPETVNYRVPSRK